MKELLINNFLRISSIPRESGHEEKIANFFVDIAKENNLYYFKDEYNNVLIKKKGDINSDPIALQAHLDMVCVKRRDSTHDFNEDGIQVVIEGDKVTAKDTSLGADQGIGLAIMLTLMEDDNIHHPDLEFLFTVEEETTFKGAVTFPYSKVDSKRLINLDNSIDDAVFIGADGDVCNEYSFNNELVETNLPSYRVLLDDFPGGNSSEDIALSENNAITTMARLLKDKDILLRSINGGTCENDLAISCEAVLNTSLDINEIFKGTTAKIEKLENYLCFTREDTVKIINEILDLRCGHIGDLSSANLGTITTKENEIKIEYVFRSMDDKELERMGKEMNSLPYSFTVKEIYRDPIWKVNSNSELLRKYKELYFQEYAEYPREGVFHGAIECSSIKKRIDGLDIISIGSIIKKYHTVDEVTYISSWIKIYNLLVQFLETLGDSKY